MVLDLGLAEDMKSHERPRVLRGWGPPCERAFRHLVWAEWAASPFGYSRAVQTQLFTPDFVVATQQLVEELSFKLGEVLSAIATDVEQLCQHYVNRVSAIDIVREVLLVETDEITTVWTIIDAPPFEDSVREPVYQAQLQILRELEGDTVLDFYVLNVSELPKKEKLERIVPPDARLLWRR